MAAHLIVTPPLNERFPLSLGVEEPQVIRPGRTVSSQPLHPVLAPRGKSWLSEAMLEASPTRPRRRTGDVLASAAFHLVFLVTSLMLPLYFTHTIDLKQFSSTLLIAPPPPPAPATAVVQALPAVEQRLFTGGKLLAPIVIPKQVVILQVVILKEEPMPADADVAGVPGGVLGGVPGGQMGGVLGGILGGIPTSVAKGRAPPAEKARAPIRVGGRVRAPRAIYRPAPNYPPLAKQARIQGDVTIDAVIDKTGTVVELKAVSGPSVLIPAALAAARTWKFEPTYLNDEPIDVQFILTVQFQLQN
jgi:protein TonB